MLQYKVISSLKDLENYKEIWSLILEKNKNDNPFIEFEWIDAWWRFLGNSHPVEVYVVYNKNTPIAFCPFIHTSYLGKNRIKFISEDVATYMQVISEKQWLEPAIKFLIEELKKVQKDFS